MPFEAMISASDSHNPAAPDTIVLTPLLKQLIQQFRTARQHREQARGTEFALASEAEDKAALKLAWAIDQAEV